MLEAVVVVNHIEQSCKAPIVIKTALHMSEQSAQRSRAIRIIGRAIRLEIVNPDVRRLVRIPARLSKQRRNVTLSAGCFAVEDQFSASGGGSIKTAFRRCRWRDCKLIELK